MELIHRCLAGDPDAFASLFEQYKNLVYRTAVLLLNDCREAEDVLQEVFLKVYSSLHTYQPQKGAFTTWLYRITVNYCLNLKRKRLVDFISWENDQPVVDQLRTSSAEEQAEDVDMQRALQRLSPKLRAVIVLYYYSGLTYFEISQVLGIRLGTVESRMNQALKNIRHSMDLMPKGERGYSESEVNS